MSCGVGRRCGSDPALLLLWCRPAATAPIRPLAWESARVWPSQDKKTKEKRKKKGVVGGLDWLPLLIIFFFLLGRAAPPLTFHFQVQTVSHSWKHSRVAPTPVFGLMTKNGAFSILRFRKAPYNYRTLTCRGT